MALQVRNEPTQQLSVAAPQRMPVLAVQNQATQPLRVVNEPTAPLSVDTRYNPYQNALEDYNKLNYFISDGSQVGQDGKPYVPGQVVFEAPDYFTNSSVFKEQITPILNQAVQFDADGKPNHPLLTKEVTEGINEAFNASKNYADSVSQVTQNTSLDEQGARTFLDSLATSQKTGELTLPNGSTTKVQDILDEMKDHTDIQKAMLLKKYEDIVEDKKNPSDARGRAAAVLSIVADKGANRGNFNEKLGYFNAEAGSVLVKSAYGLADLVIPDSIAKVSKYDSSRVAKEVDYQNNLLSTQLEGYTGYIKGGQLYGTGLNIALAIASGNAISAATKFAAVKTLAATGNALTTAGRTAQLAGAIEDGALLFQGGRVMAALGDTATTLATFIPKSKLLGIGIESSAQSLSFAALSPEEHHDFGKSYLKNAALFAAGDLLTMGLVRGFKYARDAATAVTVRGLSAEAAGSVLEGVTKDADDIARLVSTEGSGAKAKFTSGIADVTGKQTTEAVLDATSAGKSLTETVHNGFIERLNSVTSEQSAELFVNGHKAGVAEKVLGKELAGEYRSFVDALRESANKLGLKIDYLENFFSRTGSLDSKVTEGVVRAPGLKTSSLSENERTYKSGSDLLKATGGADNVHVADLLRNYSREVSSAALNRAATLRLVQSGEIIRAAKEGSPTLKAAYDAGGVTKITKVIDGGEVTVGYAATPEWLAQNGYRTISNNVVDGALNQLKGLSKDYSSGFYANDGTTRILDNFVSSATETLTTKAVAKTAALSARVQDLILSGGIPFTPVNNFAITQLMGAMMSDPLNFGKYVKSFARSFSEAGTREYFIKELQSSATNANILDFVKNGGTNIIPKWLLGGERQGEKVAVTLGEDTITTLNKAEGLKSAAAADTSAAGKARADADRARSKADKATEKVAQLETATRAGTADLEKLQKAQAAEKTANSAARKLETAAKKLEKAAGASSATAEKAGALASTEDASYDILNAVGNTSMIDKAKGTAKEVGEIWDDAVSKTTFDRLMPMIQWETTKSIIQKGLNSGLTEEAAYAAGRGAMKNFWNIGEKNGLGSWGSKQTQKVIEDIKTTFIAAPKYRASVINRWWNTLKLLNPKNLTSLEYRLNARWAMTGLSLFIAANVGNKMANGHYTWQNPTGSIDELQIPYGDGKILRFSVWGSQASIVRSLGRAADAAVSGDGKKLANESIGLSSVFAQPLLRTATNLDYTGGQTFGPDSKNGDRNVLNIGKYLLSKYTAHPFVGAVQASESGNVLQAALTALELPVRTTNIKKAAVGNFYDSTIPAIEGIVTDYQARIYRTIDETEKEDLFKEMVDTVTKEVRKYGTKWNIDVTQLDPAMAKRILTTIIGKTAVPLGGNDNLGGNEQIDVQAEQRAKVRETARNAGLDLFNGQEPLTKVAGKDVYGDVGNDQLTDAKNKVYGAPKRIAYEFQNLVNGDKKNGVPSLYDVKKTYDQRISALYEKASETKDSNAKTAVYAEIAAAQKDYMDNGFDPYVKPLIDKYGVNIVANNSQVFDELRKYVIVPSDLMPFASSKKQPYLTSDVKQYLQDRYGVGPINDKALATDPEVVSQIQAANADISAGRLQSANFKLTQAQQSVNAGKSYADNDTMNEIAATLLSINKRRK